MAFRPRRVAFAAALALVFAAALLTSFADAQFPPDFNWCVFPSHPKCVKKTDVGSSAVVGAAPAYVATTAAATTYAEPTTAEATTAAPTYAAPTTAAPTTAAPTYAAPTTAAPTTAAPTTAAPTTARPTTAAPTTARPTTAAPTTARPTTVYMVPPKAAPTTARPTTVYMVPPKATTARATVNMYPPKAATTTSAPRAGYGPTTKRAGSGGAGYPSSGGSGESSVLSGGVHGCTRYAERCLTPCKAIVGYENYYGCEYTLFGHWDYCSPRGGRKTISRLTKKCQSKCSPVHAEQYKWYHWCFTDVFGWDYCSPDRC